MSLPHQIQGITFHTKGSEKAGKYVHRIFEMTCFYPRYKLVRTSRLSPKEVDQMIKIEATESEDFGMDIWNIGRARKEGAEIMVRYV